jgi:hypothetical protein
VFGYLDAQIREDVMDERYTPGSYGQFCPVAMASEIVCNRWTALVLRELLCGSFGRQKPEWDTFCSAGGVL